MGNHVSNGSTRVILPDGTVTKYDEPVMVAELMLNHPQQVVVEFHPVAKKPKPLVADYRLEKNKVYLMVPKMSLEDAERILLRANAVLRSGLFMSAYTGIIPVIVKMWSGPEKVSEKSPAVMKSSSGLFREVGLVTEGRDGYCLKKSWKPSLDTIKEKGVKAKIDVPLVSLNCSFNFLTH